MSVPVRGLLYDHLWDSSTTRRDRSMSLSLALLSLVVGIAVLALGGETIVRGATAIAQMAGLPPAVIGLTVVAMGTSLPELVVSVTAAFEGTPDLALGNVIGSNIFNITATLGLTAMIVELPVRGSVVRLEWPVMFLASLLCVVVLRDAQIDRLEATLLVTGLIVFTAYSVRIARRDTTEGEKKEFAATVDARTLRPAWRRSAIAGGTTLLGVALLVAGGQLLVQGAVIISRWAGMSERVIGLTVVAIGTGTPEIATSLVAAYRKQTDVAIANMIGSNIFNILGILGVTALVSPIRGSAAFAGNDLWWMLGTAFVLFPVMRRGMRITRIEGLGLIVVYAVYLVRLL
jgi:cation:H+ antiporter